MRILASLVLASLVAGCATDPAGRDAGQLALYRGHAGAPVPSFPYYGQMSSWTPLGDSSLALWSSPSRAWLLDLDGPCNDLVYAQGVRLSTGTGRVHARFDDVTPIGTGMRSLPCRIREIRPIDVAALRQARRLAKARSNP